jgi:hypothetical protein
MRVDEHDRSSSAGQSGAGRHRAIILTFVPVSRSKRKRGGRRRPPPAIQTHPKKRRTRRWVPYVFFTCIGIGVVLILATYIFWNGQASTLFGGLGLIGVAFAVSTQWY